jgi:FtsH-binding integral membrane protein
MSFYSNVNTDVRAQSLDISIVMRQVYLFMTIGLAISAGVAYYTATSGLALAIFDNPILTIGIFLGYMLLAFTLRPIIMNSPVSVGAFAFFLLSAVLGLMLSSIFLTGAQFAISYTETRREIVTTTLDPSWLQTVGLAFALTAGTFAAMSVIGFTTKVDLSRYGGAFLMALIGLLIASVVNMLFQNDFLYWIISYAGVLIFAGLVAYKTQWIKEMAARVSQGAINQNGVAVVDSSVQRMALYGAFELYITFINLFLFILRILGGRRR